MKYSLIVGTGLLLLATAGKTAPNSSTNFGIIAYWGETPSTYSGQIPYGSYVVINPNSGALGMSQIQMDNYVAIVKNIRAQGGKVLGYIPTGYNQGTADEKTRYNAILENIKVYKNNLGNVDGFFFDEAAYDSTSITDKEKCDGTAPKWSAIRSILNTADSANVIKVWNAGWPGMSGCFVSSAVNGEHVVISETSYKDYLTAASWLEGPVQDLANSLGVKTWLLVHSANKVQMQTVLKNTNANNIYVTSMSYDPSQPWGGPIWNYTPSYWGNEYRPYSERGLLKILKLGI